MLGSDIIQVFQEFFVQLEDAVCQIKQLDARVELEPVGVRIVPPGTSPVSQTSTLLCLLSPISVCQILVVVREVSLIFLLISIR